MGDHGIGDKIPHQLQMAAIIVEGAHTRDRDEGRDQPIFDGGCTLSVAQERAQSSSHLAFPVLSVPAATIRADLLRKI